MFEFGAEFVLADAPSTFKNENTGPLDAVGGEVKSHFVAENQSLKDGWKAQDSYG